MRAWELHDKGWKQQEIADAMGVTQGAVSQWLKRGREGGEEGLRHRPPPGAPSRLSQEQRDQLLELLSQGAESFGFQGDVWTLPRVATLIRDQLGVSYHPAHVGRILKACGWSSSSQKPAHRATQRNEEAIQRWKEELGPSSKKGHRGRADSSLCGPVRLLPAARQSTHLRPRRPDPHYPCPLESRPLSAMGGITPQGKLYLMVQERAYRGEDVVGFLKHLTSHISGKLLVIWDVACIHRSRVVKEYLSNGDARRIYLEQLPGYAPDLNPAEGIWNYLKGVELKNLCCQSISHLNYELCKAKERLRHKTSVILGCVKQPGLY